MSCDRYKDHEGVWCGDPFCVLIIPRLRGTKDCVLFDEFPTTEYVLAERCPSCRSLETEPFETHVDGTKHCLPCGRVFR